MTLLEIDRGDLEGALCAFDDEVQEVLLQITWNRALMEKIVLTLRRELFTVYIDLLPSAIKEAIKDEIEEMNSKRNFLSGLRRYLKIGRKK